MRVVTRSGTSPVTAADRFTFVAAPTVTAVSPAAAPAGVSVTITGHNFVGVTAVDFGTTAATGVRTVSSTEIVAVAPKHAPGTVAVTVVAYAKRSAGSSAGTRFRYLATPKLMSVTLPLPGNATAGSGFVTGFSCPVVNWCAAVGDYSTPSSADHGFLDVYDNGAVTSVQVPTPSTSAGEAVNDIACSAKQQCVLVGQFTRSTGGTAGVIRPLAVTLSGATRTPAELPGADGTGLRKLACTSAGCAALVYNPVGVADSILYTERLGSWTAQTMPQPTGEHANIPPSLSSIGCTRTGACVAVGSWTDSSVHSHPLVESFTGGVWHQSTGAAPAGYTSASLLQLSCTTVCVAGGGASRGTGNSQQDVVFTESIGAAGVSVVPGNAAQADGPSALDCVSTSDCLLTGYFRFAAAPRTRTLIAHQSGRTWTTTPATAGSAQFSTTGIACPTASSCAISGQSFGTGPSRAGFLAQYGSEYLAVLSTSSDFTLGVACPAARHCVVATSASLLVES